MPIHAVRAVPEWPESASSRYATSNEATLGYLSPAKLHSALRKAILLALYLAMNGAGDVRRDLAVMCPRTIKNTQTQVFRMARPSSRALVLRW